VPQPRFWLDLAPLSTRTALRTTPLGDFDVSMELAEPPLVGITRLPPATRSRLESVNGARWTRNAVGVHRHAPFPVVRIPCWCLRRGRACQTWVAALLPPPLPPRPPICSLCPYQTLLFHLPLVLFLPLLLPSRQPQLSTLVSPSSWYDLGSASQAR